MKQYRWMKGTLAALLALGMIGVQPLSAEEEQSTEEAEILSEENTEDAYNKEQEEVLTEEEAPAEEETPAVEEEPAEEETPEEEPEEPFDPSTISSDEASIRGFVVRLYRIALGREAELSGYTYWTERITDGTVTGCKAVRGFFLSAEFLKKGLGDDEYVRTLYRTILNREADEPGLEYWKERLSVHMTREWVMNGFLNSQEFTNLCNAYGVTRGTAGSTGKYRDKNYNITAFVNRMYTTVLNRSADVSGLENWCKKIHSANATGADLVLGFFMSPEFIMKGLSNTDFVKTCYRAILDREGSAKEISSWAATLSTKSRKEVLAGFANSAEFNNLCNKYGMKRGTIVLNGWRKENGKDVYYKSNGQKAAMEVLTIGGKEYGFNADGVWIGNKTSAYLTVYKKAIAQVKATVSSSMSKAQKLRACFDVFKTFREKNPWIPHDRSEGWELRYGNNCFDTKSGNCMSYGVAFAFMAKVLGYEEVYCCNSGGHGWAEIDGLVYDPEWTLHREGNFFGRPLGTGSGNDPDYKNAIQRYSGAPGYVKL